MLSICLGCWLPGGASAGCEGGRGKVWKARAWREICRIRKGGRERGGKGKIIRLCTWLCDLCYLFVEIRTRPAGGMREGGREGGLEQGREGGRVEGVIRRGP